MRLMYPSSSSTIINIPFSCVFGGISIIVSNQNHFLTKGNGFLLGLGLLLFLYWSCYLNESHSSSLCHPEGWGPADKWMPSSQSGVFTAFMFGHSSPRLLCKCFHCYPEREILLGWNWKDDINLTLPFGVSTKWQDSRKQLKSFLWQEKLSDSESCSQSGMVLTRDLLW